MPIALFLMCKKYFAKHNLCVYVKSERIYEFFKINDFMLGKVFF